MMEDHGFSGESGTSEPWALNPDPDRDANGLSS